MTQSIFITASNPYGYAIGSTQSVSDLVALQALADVTQQGGWGRLAGSIWPPAPALPGALTSAQAAALAAVAPVVLASGTSAATANTTALQNAINAGGVIQPTGSGVCYINATLLYGSDTTIRDWPGLTIRMVSGINKAMLQPKALALYQAGGTTVTLTWSAGTSVSVAQTAHGRSVGDAVYIWNVTPWVYCGAFKIESVTDANNYVIRLPYTPSATPTGTAKMIQAVQRFRLEGLTWDYNTNSGGNLDAHILGLYFAEDCHIVRPTRGTNGAKYVACLAGVLNCTVAIDSPFNQSDGVKVYGPARSTKVLGVTGTFGDDIVSVQNAEWSGAYTGYQATGGGELYDVRVINVNGTTASTDSVVSLYVADGIKCDRVEFEDCYGYGGISGGQVTGQSSASPVGTVTFKNCGPQGVTNKCFTVGYCSIDALTLDGWKFNPDSAGTVGGILLLSTSTIKQFNVLRPDISSPIWDNTGGADPVISSQGTIYNAVIDGGYTNSVSTFRGGLMNIAAGSCYNVTVQNCNLSGGSTVVLVSPGLSVAPVISIKSNVFNGQNNFLNVNGPCTLNLSGNNVISAPGPGILRFNASASVRINSDGTNTFNGTSIWTVGAGTATVTCYGNDLVVDAGLVATTKGQYFSHSSAVAGRNAANQQGLCVGVDGTHFYALGTGAAGVNTLIL